MSTAKSTAPVTTNFIAEDEDPNNQAMFAEMMDLLQESQQVYLGDSAEIEEPALSTAVTDDEAEDARMQQEAMDLILESQQQFSTPVEHADTSSIVGTTLLSEASDLMGIFARGGSLAIALMQYCVRSRNFDPLFVMLVREFKMRPTLPAALAIYDSFCATDAAAAVSLRDSVVGNELRQQIESLRRQSVTAIEVAQAETVAANENEPIPRACVVAPPNFIFDGVVRALQSNPHSGFNHAAYHYHAERSAQQNLPGGMNMAQRNFLSRVWIPILRPRLVAAGFWRMSTIE